MFSIHSINEHTRRISPKSADHLISIPPAKESPLCQGGNLPFCLQIRRLFPFRKYQFGRFLWFSVWGQSCHPFWKQEARPIDDDTPLAKCCDFFSVDSKQFGLMSFCEHFSAISLFVWKKFWIYELLRHVFLIAWPFAGIKISYFISDFFTSYPLKSFVIPLTVKGFFEERKEMSCSFIVI